MQTSIFLQLLFAYLAAAQVRAPDEGSNPETVQDDVVVYPTGTLNTGIPATSVLPGSPESRTGITSLGEPVPLLPPAPEPQPYPTGPVEAPVPVGPTGPGPVEPTAPGPGPSLPTGPEVPGPAPVPVPVPVPTGPPGPPGPPSGPPPPGVTGPGTGYPPMPPGATPTAPVGPPPPYFSGGDRAVSATLGSGALIALIMCAVAIM